MTTNATQAEIERDATLLRDGEMSIEQQLDLTADDVLFCKAVVLEGLSQIEAFIKVRQPSTTNRKTLQQSATKYAGLAKRRKYMAYLQIQARAAVPVTALSIVKELEEARLLAIRVEDPKAMVAASLGKAKVVGMGELLGDPGATQTYEYTRATEPAQQADE